MEINFLLPKITIEPKLGKPQASVIWLHGLGADGNDFAPVVSQFGQDLQANVRFIFPHAPKMPVTLNGGLVMPAWYDVLGLDLSQSEDEKGIVSSEAMIAKLIHNEIEQGIDAQKIVLIGFSQGGAVSLFTAIRFPQALGGAVALSSYLPLREKLAVEKHTANAKIPIFLAHGLLDPIVPFSLGKQSLGCLQGMGYEPIFRTYPIPHSVCPQELFDLEEWLLKILRL